MRSATVTNGGTVEYDGTLMNDIYIGYLSAPITNITPFKLLPSNYATYMPTLQDTALYSYRQLPCFMKSSHSLSNNPRDVVKVLGLSDMRTGGCSIGMPPNAEMAAWCSSVGVPVTGGDSGSAIFVKINSDAVLLTSPTQVAFGNNLAAKRGLMDALGTSFGTPLIIGTADLSGFTAY